MWPLQNAIHYLREKNMNKKVGILKKKIKIKKLRNAYTVEFIRKLPRKHLFKQ